MQSTLSRFCALALLTIPSASFADGFYNLYGPGGDKWGEVAFMEVTGNDTVWVWDTEEGDVTFFIHNPRGNQGDWSQGTYYGYYVLDMPDSIAPPCRGRAIADGYGNRSTQWGDAVMDWSSQDGFVLAMSECGTGVPQQLSAAYAWGEEQATDVVPVSAVLDLQSVYIPLSYDDPASTWTDVMYNPAIYLDVTFSDGSTYEAHYNADIPENVIFDDVSGDPYDLISVEYWDVQTGNPSAGQYAAQLSATGNGTGVATLWVSLADAPGVTASVTVEVVSGY